MAIHNKTIMASFDRVNLNDDVNSEFSESLGEVDELEALFDTSTATGDTDLKIEHEEANLRSWHTSYDKVLKLIRRKTYYR